ncbi:MAG: HEPN domain-containing protein [Sedimentisphaerales bacterium]|jgi:HEPN domain-containing protein|nr:HEPN domain-containing protein [Sedimentisphaerales bacterium]
MKPMTVEWVAKAEGDFAMMERECRAQDNPSYDGICFHAQQCAEKYLKGRLCEADITFGKIHDLVALLEQAFEVEPQWEQFREDLAYLSDFAVTFRYPGESADAESAFDSERRRHLFRDAARWVWKSKPVAIHNVSKQLNSSLLYCF